MLVHSELTLIDACSAQFPTYVGLAEIYDPDKDQSPLQISEVKSNSTDIRDTWYEQLCVLAKKAFHYSILRFAIGQEDRCRFDKPDLAT